MSFFLKFDVEKSPQLIEPHHQILLIGSCFTEHMGMRFRKWGWDVFQNPTGVIYNPHSVSVALDRSLDKRRVSAEELYEYDGAFHHWDFHSRFSHVDKIRAAEEMNASLDAAHEFLKSADWIFITWGSAHYYTLRDNNYQVSNCHRVPNKLFEKAMYEIDQMYTDVSGVLDRIRAVNPHVKICQTVSPVRHIKDGIVENSRSKARLTELSFRLQKEACHYFPAYEILIDELRDYRFFDADLVHPNYSATQYVWDKFTDAFFSDQSKVFLKQMIELSDAYQHKPRFPQTDAHRRFLDKYLGRCQELEQRFPHLDLSDYKKYFAGRADDLSPDL